ncbi:hypothetical protein LWI28_014027 [Acer negundo]|uniref:Uncharacterized protein n=1 Tax=Acer negundo TaxID=4023 RepID=A0AAD5J689_ACENE|nr:hypothetical protein LWI28_014027 [Acer negundo]
MKASGIFRKNNFQNLKGMSVLNDHNSTNIIKVESERKMVMPISALAEVHEEERNVAEKGLIADTFMIDAPIFENLGSMKSANINVCIDAIKAIKDLEGESENLEYKKSASFNGNIIAINAIKALKMSLWRLLIKDEEPYVFVRDMKVKVQAENPMKQLISVDPDGKRNGDISVDKEELAQKKHKEILVSEGNAIVDQILEKEVSRNNSREKGDDDIPGKVFENKLNYWVGEKSETSQILSLSLFNLSLLKFWRDFGF